MLLLADENCNCLDIDMLLIDMIRFTQTQLSVLREEEFDLLSPRPTSINN